MKKYLAVLLAAVFSLTVICCRSNDPSVPEGTTVPETTLRPDMSSEPETTVSPMTTQVPKTTTEPGTTVSPETTVKPETTDAPETTIAPETTAAPETTVTPATTAVPETTARPAAGYVDTDLFRFRLPEGSAYKYEDAVTMPPSDTYIAMITGPQAVGVPADYVKQNVENLKTNGFNYFYWQKDIRDIWQKTGMGNVSSAREACELLANSMLSGKFKEGNVSEDFTIARSEKTTVDGSKLYIILQHQAYERDRDLLYLFALSDGKNGEVILFNGFLADNETRAAWDIISSTLEMKH